MRTVLALGVLLVGGCLGGPSPGLEDSAGLVPTAPSWLEDAQLVGPGADAEASIDVSDDGQTILLCTHGGFTQASPFWASTDGGETFRRYDPQPNHPFNGDCDVEVGPDGSWYIVYDTIYSATVAATHDEGRSWTVSLVTALPLGGVDRPWIEASDDGALYMSYQNVAALEPAINVFAVSHDAGRTWIQRVFSHAEPPERVWTIGGDPFSSDGGRTVRIVLSHSSASGSDSIELALSRDAGETWTKQPIASDLDVVGGIPSAALAGDGTLYAAYSTPDSADIGDVVVHISHDDGATWNGPHVVAADEAFAGLVPTVWVDARPDGSASLVWMARWEENGTETWQPKLARVRDNGTFQVEFVEPLGARGQWTDLYEFSMVRHDDAGRVHVVYPLVTGPDCKETPWFPSQVGSNDIPRNNHCLYVVREPPAGA